VEVLEHDIVSGGLPADAFDLVHSRLVLDLIPDRKIALRNMVRAVKPGGWVVVEEFDSITSVPDSVIGESGVAVFRRIQDAMFMSWNEKGIDAYLGRKILMELRSCGLEQLGGEGRVFMRQGGSDGTIGWRMSVESLRKDFLTGQFATNEEIDAHLRQLDDPELAYMSPLMMATWGRRPHSSSKK
jgi:Methyltransferase domain.